MAVTAVFILSSLGFAIIAQAPDCSKPAAGPNMDLRDEYITQKTFADGSKVYFACNSGYTSAGGSPSITCTSGTWSSVQLQCERKSCGRLGEVPNGDVDYAGIEFGDTATVTCNPGYMLVGRSSIRCEVNGWSSRLPICDAVKCTPPAPVANGAFAPHKDFYLFGEIVRYSCFKGLVLNGSKDITCSNDGKFSPSPPNCVRQPVYDCADRMRTTVAETSPTTTCIETTKIPSDTSEQSLQVNQTSMNVFFGSIWTGVPLWYELLRWGSMTVLIIRLCIFIRCTKTSHKKHGRRRKKFNMG